MKTYSTIYKELSERTVLSKSQELHNQSISSLQSHNSNGIHVKVRIHPASQAQQRRPDLNHDHWKEIMHHATNTIKNKPAGHYLTYSKKHQQGFVHEWYPKEKKMELITVLPKGRNNAKSGTQRHMVESIENLIYIEIE